MARVLFPIVVGASCMVVALTAAQAITAMIHVSPTIGDIVAFVPTKEPPMGDDTRLIVHRADRFGCVLDLGVLRQSGGSLVVEGQISDAPSSFRVRWSGPRTTADAANCGGNTVLILERRELDILATNAGGYGVGQKRMPVFPNPGGA